ncbi:MAG: hypothetical protein ACFE8G_15320, partial [Candidatus Hermodarchaeota archaeon]
GVIIATIILMFPDPVYVRINILPITIIIFLFIIVGGTVGISEFLRPHYDDDPHIEMKTNLI